MFRDEKRLAFELSAAPYAMANDAIEVLYAALPDTRGATGRRRKAEPSEGADKEMGDPELAGIGSRW